MKRRNRIYLGILLFAACFILGSSLQTKNVSAAKAKYVVKVNKQQNCVTAYKVTKNNRLKPVRAMICSAGNATPLGTFSLGEKYRWHKMNGNCYAQYCSRIHGGILFHSVWYYYNYNPASISSTEYNKLGTLASHGCIRLTTKDAKWIYDNVSSGSKVIIYNSSNPGPLGRPTAVKLPGRMSWDPTDIWSAGNPWNKKKPTISAKSRKVKCGADFDVMDGVSAQDALGNNVIVYAKTDLSLGIVGTYTIYYTAIDEQGNTGSSIRRITIQE